MHGYNFARGNWTILGLTFQTDAAEWQLCVTGHGIVLRLLACLYFGYIHKRTNIRFQRVKPLAIECLIEFICSFLFRSKVLN